MHKKFDHEAIEKKWQEAWTSQGLYDVTVRDTTKEKTYVLVEFPYPSGNLHIGHWFAFAVVDIYVRALRMQGRQVFFPIGFDSFGLPAENAAIKRKLNPKTWTEDNIAHMMGQLKSMGNAFSWNALLRTSDPAYYRYTQWMFTEFFKKGIAYRGEGTVNWCPSCNTVLANEQVIAGACERCGAVVTQKVMNQWMLRISKYADRLIDDLDALPWPEHIKDSQRNWIGRKEGAEIDFLLTSGDTVTVFTTRPDTLFGATYLVLAPEHPLVNKLKHRSKTEKDIDLYVESALKKQELERTKDTKEKTGVLIEGVTAKNPANGKQIPIYISDYVLGHYGTGALMAVPAHDERDFVFAQTFNLPIVQVINTHEALPYAGEGKLVNSGAYNGIASEIARKDIVSYVGGRTARTYRLRDWSVGRQRYWGVPIPIVYDPQGNPHPVPKEHLPWLLPEDVDVTPTGEPPLKKSQELKERTERIFGVGWTPEVETMDTFVDSSWHFLRYTDVKNDSEFCSREAQNAWMPVDIYFGGAEHTTMHLLYSRFWQKALFDLGYTTVEEPYATRINRGLVLGPDGNKMSKSKGNVIDPDTQVKALGADTVKMYLAFMGPYGEMSNYPWDMGGIAGLRRFLERANGLLDQVTESSTPSLDLLLNETIEKVRSDIALYKFNTAISALMIFLNVAEKEGLSRDAYRTFLLLLAPFAPHLTEELWSAFGETVSIHTMPYPEADKELLKSKAVTIAVQVNGKTKGTVTMPQDSEEDAVLSQVYALEVVKKALEEKTILRVIFVKNKIINLLTNVDK